MANTLNINGETQFYTHNEKHRTMFRNPICLVKESGIKQIIFIPLRCYHSYNYPGLTTRIITNNDDNSLGFVQGGGTYDRVFNIPTNYSDVIHINVVAYYQPDYSVGELTLTGGTGYIQSSRLHWSGGTIYFGWYYNHPGVQYNGTWYCLTNESTYYYLSLHLIKDSNGKWYFCISSTTQYFDTLQPMYNYSTNSPQYLQECNFTFEDCSFYTYKRYEPIDKVYVERFSATNSTTYIGLS